MSYLRNLPYFAAGFAALVTLFIPGVTYAKDNKKLYEGLELLGEVIERIDNDYVERPDWNKAIEAGIDGMLRRLDPHSGYIGPKSFRDMQVDTRGENGGAGLEVSMVKGLVKVVAPIDGSPAHESGILAGDLITHIDGEQVLGLALEQAVERMRGPVGTQLKFTINRESSEKPIDITVVRDVIRVNPVKSRMIGTTGYVQISTLNNITREKLVTAIKKLKINASKEKLNLILDLRNNPGGLLDQAIAISDEFLNEGLIVVTQGRSAEETQMSFAKPGDILNGGNLVILINGGTASGSEIITTALQDNNRATVIGTRSYGRGTVQTIIPMVGGAIRLTTAQYLTPNNNSIQSKGVQPDVIVKQVAPAEPNSKDIGKSHDIPKDQAQDSQLQHAIELLKN